MRILVQVPVHEKKNPESVLTFPKCVSDTDVATRAAPIIITSTNY